MRLRFIALAATLLVAACGHLPQSMTGAGDVRALVPHRFGQTCTPASQIQLGVPATNAPLTSAPIRNNFQSAANDINNLYQLSAGATAPSCPFTYQLWENTTASPPALEQYDGAQWVKIGTINPSTHVYTLDPGVVVNTSQLTGNPLSASLLPAPTTSSLGGTQAYSAPTHQYLTGISNAGVPQSAQPSAGDITGLGSSATLPAAGTGSTVPTTEGTPATGSIAEYNADGSLSGVSGGAGTGTVTNVATGSGLTGGPITSTGTVACNTISSSTTGCGKVDGTTITASGGTISAATATSGAAGIVKPDNSTITASGGVITAASTTINGVSCTPGSSCIASNPAPVFGDGSDGDVTCSGASTLTRDMFYNNLTLSSGCAITTAGYRIFVAGTLDISAAPAGAIQWNGSAGTNGGNGAAGAGGGSASGASGLTSENLGGSNGGANGATGGTGAGTAGLHTTCATAEGGGTIAAGQGGTTTANGTAAAGGIAVTPSYLGMAWPEAPAGTTYVATTLTIPIGGCGGATGGGGNGNGTNGGGTSGGAGSGGGVIVIVAHIIARGTNTTAGIIQAKGGNAGTSGNGYSSGTSAGAGGTAGAGGGMVIVILGSETGSTITGAIDVSGGNGAAGGTGYGSGSTGGYGGASGDSGRVQIYNLFAGTLTATAPVAGTAGSANSGATGGAAGTANTQQVNL